MNETIKRRAAMAFDFKTFPELETERLRLRQIRRGDYDDLARVHRDPQVRRYLSEFEYGFSDNAIWSVIDWADDIFNRRKGARWAITRQPDDELIGTCGFHAYDRLHLRAEIGYDLRPDHWRQGIMTEAAGEVARFCFDEMALHRVEADVTEGNAASAALLQKLGFTLEGVWRERFMIRGQLHNIWQFGLLEPEYRRGAGKPR